MMVFSRDILHSIQYDESKSIPKLSLMMEENDLITLIILMPEGYHS